MFSYLSCNCVSHFPHLYNSTHNSNFNTHASFIIVGTISPASGAISVHYIVNCKQPALRQNRVHSYSALSLCLRTLEHRDIYREFVTANQRRPAPRRHYQPRLLPSFSSSLVASVPLRPFMAHKKPCAKYQYVITPAGPKILPVDEPSVKDEESPADYNAGGYLPIKLSDTFQNGRYRVVRKLGHVPPHLLFISLLTNCHSWGHFSTVWLVKDAQYGSSFFHARSIS